MSPIFSERSCSGVILYIEDVDLNFLNGSLVIHPLVILYIEDVDLNALKIVITLITSKSSSTLRMWI